MYQPGELKAIAYKDGKRVGEKVVQTSASARSLRLTPDRTVLKNSGDDLCYILVESYDKNNIFCPKADNFVHINVEGPATIAAVGNGNPQSLEPFNADYRSLFFGRAMLIVRSKRGQSGKVKISAQSSDLESAEIQIIVR